MTDYRVCVSRNLLVIEREGTGESEGLTPFFATVPALSAAMLRVAEHTDLARVLDALIGADKRTQRAAALVCEVLRAGGDRGWLSADSFGLRVDGVGRVDVEGGEYNPVDLGLACARALLLADEAGGGGDGG